VARHTFEVDVISTGGKIVDMQVNEKRRSITWENESGETGSINVPRTFDLSKLDLVQGSTPQQCKVVLPEMGQGIFN